MLQKNKVGYGRPKKKMYKIDDFKSVCTHQLTSNFLKDVRVMEIHSHDIGKDIVGVEYVFSYNLNGQVYKHGCSLSRDEYLKLNNKYPNLSLRSNPDLLSHYFTELFTNLLASVSADIHIKNVKLKM